MSSSQFHFGSLIFNLNMILERKMRSWFLDNGFEILEEEDIEIRMQGFTQTVHVFGELFSEIFSEILKIYF